MERADREQQGREDAAAIRAEMKETRRRLDELELTCAELEGNALRADWLRAKLYNPPAEHRAWVVMMAAYDDAALGHLSYEQISEIRAYRARRDEVSADSILGHAANIAANLAEMKAAS